jgi:branched-subunit amino acid aminotransferase/4-amino-4-deoxychorismate lyase
VREPAWALVGQRLTAAEAVRWFFWTPAGYLGEGLFETVGCDGGRPLLWREHARRLTAGMAALGMSPCTLPGDAAVRRLLAREGLSGTAVVRIVAHVDRGQSRAVTWAARYRPPRAARRRGVALVPLVVPAGPLAGLKTCSYLPYSDARRSARLAGGDAALLLDGDGAVREADHANVFLASGGAVLTPRAPGRCLGGVMRAWCIAALSAASVRVEERDLDLDTVLTADEVWLTSSLAGVVPVRGVGSQDLSVPRRLVAKLEAAGIPAPGCRSRRVG